MFHILPELPVTWVCAFAKLIKPRCQPVKFILYKTKGSLFLFGHPYCVPNCGLTARDTKVKYGKHSHSQTLEPKRAVESKWANAVESVKSNAGVSSLHWGRTWGKDCKLNGD